MYKLYSLLFLLFFLPLHIGAQPASISPKDTTIKFLWREMRYDADLKDTFSTIIINEDYCKVISDPEKAAIAYVAYDIGSECEWDGEGKEDRSNLKCKVPYALRLGYQCSDTQIVFLRKWFRNDPKVLKELKGCPTTPFTATVQETFIDITISTKGDMITVGYKVEGVNSFEGYSWDWSEKVTFKKVGDSIKIAKRKRSKVKKHKMNSGE